MTSIEIENVCTNVLRRAIGATDDAIQNVGWGKVDLETKRGFLNAMGIPVHNALEDILSDV